MVDGDKESHRHAEQHVTQQLYDCFRNLILLKKRKTPNEVLRTLFVEFAWQTFYVLRSPGILRLLQDRNSSDSE